MHGDHILVHRFVTPEAKVGQPKLNFEIKVDDFARPASGIALQDGLWLAVARTGKVRRVLLPRVPFRDQNAEIEWNLFQPPLELADEIRSLFFLRIAHRYFRVPLVCLFSVLFVESYSIELAV